MSFTGTREVSRSVHYSIWLLPSHVELLHGACQRQEQLSPLLSGVVRWPWCRICVICCNRGGGPPLRSIRVQAGRRDSCYEDGGEIPGRRNVVPRPLQALRTGDCE